MVTKHQTPKTSKPAVKTTVSKPAKVSKSKDVKTAKTHRRPLPATILSLDVGEVRIGVALARLDVRIARPLTTLVHDEHIMQAIIDLAKDHDTYLVVIGWPRDMSGQETQQTRDVVGFATHLHQASGLVVHLQDEALTSQKAEAVLKARRKPYEKADIDALAAAYILQDYIETLPSDTTLAQGSHV